jgi:hypothetical protein
MIKQLIDRILINKLDICELKFLEPCVGALIGATLGVAIERYINHLVYRNGVAGFTYDLINTTLVEGWLVPFKITIQYNLLNALFSIINFAGGNWSAGAAGAPRPSTLPSFGYAK